MGSTAGMCAITVCYPFDLIRRMLHLSGIGGTPEFKGTTDVIRWIVQREGVKGLYKGFRMTLVKSIPASAIMFVTNEQIKRLIRGE